jgi:four helix bundle protein
VSAECGIRNTEWSDRIRWVNMVQGDLKNRTKRLALEIIKICETLPKGRTAEVLGRQLLRAGTSAGANYRSACRARSTADFISKMGVVEEELDESIYWIELLVESGILKSKTVDFLVKEANELLSITVASINTAKRRTK